MKGWFVSLFHALFPFTDPDRSSWRATMERQYEDARRQNVVERRYLSRRTPPAP